MTTVKITQLPSITGANADAADVLPLVDVSLNTTNKITRQEFFNNIPSATVVGDFFIADKIVHNGDTNTAIRFPAADTITMETGGVERFRVTSDGVVGIGETSPNSFVSAGVVIKSSLAFTPAMLLWNTANDSSFSQITSRKDRAGASVQSGDAIQIIRSIGFDGTSYVQAASLTTTVDGVVSTGIVPGRFTFRTRDTAGVETERMRITSSGNVGIGNSAPVVPLHVTGATMTTGVVYQNQSAQTSIAAAATLTIAQLLTGIIQYTGAAANLTLPTGTDIESGLPATFPTNMSFDVSVINTGSGTATIVTNTGLTTVGGLTVAAGASGLFRVRKTATNTFTIYRIS